MAAISLHVVAALFIILMGRLRRLRATCNQSIWSKRWLMRRGANEVVQNLQSELLLEDNEGLMHFLHNHRMDTYSTSLYNGIF